MKPELLTPRRLAEIQHARGEDPEVRALLAHAEQQRLMLVRVNPKFSPTQPIPCPVCNSPMQDPDAMDKLELKRIRARLGARLGYQAAGLDMPLHVFAHFLRVSTGTVSYYLKGERTVDGVKSPVRIPRHVARKARELEQDATLRLPKGFIETRDMLALRKRRWANRKARGEQHAAEMVTRAREAGTPPF